MNVTPEPAAPSVVALLAALAACVLGAGCLGYALARVLWPEGTVRA